MRVPLFALILCAALCAEMALAGTPTQLAIAAGDNQTILAGNPVPGVVCVIVRDAGNSPVSGVTVTWGNITGGGSLAGETANTDPGGIATLGSWTLGPVAGVNTITASSPGLASVIFTATGTIPAGPAAQLSIDSGNNQTAAAGSPVPVAIKVLVTDADGNPAEGVAVDFGNVTGGGSISGGSGFTGFTNAGGVLDLGGWTLGKSLGIQTVTATVLGLAPVTISATAVAGGPAILAVAAGNFQAAPVGTAVTDVVCARVSDSNRIPIAGVSVTFVVTEGGGSITGADQITDANGIVTLGSWTLGPAPGINRLSASSAGLQSITFTATGEEASPRGNAVIEWNNALLQAVKNTKLAPPMSSRALAIVHTGIFDAWAAYDTRAVGTQLGGELRRPEGERTEANKEIAISYAAYRTLVDLFPSQKALFDALMAARNLDPADASTDTATPAGIGNTAAAVLLNFRHGDGSNQLGDLNPGAYTDYTSYAPVNDPDHLNNPSRWQPLRLATGQVQVFLTPHWGLVEPFAIGKGRERQRLTPKPCATHPSKAYQRQAKEVLELSANLDDRTKTIATYWADGGGTVTPPGHWFQFAQFVSRRDSHTLDDDVKLFFALGNAVFDAGIACWGSKVKYDSVRPVSAIRFLYNKSEVMAWGGPGLGTQSLKGDAFQSYIFTPPFGEYVSGHSSFSAASAVILQAFTKKPDFGLSVTIPAGSSLIEPNTPAQDVTLSWRKFTDAANEAGMSRRFGGIHFKDGDLRARLLGRKVGAIVWKKAQQYIEGTAK